MSIGLPSNAQLEGMSENEIRSRIEQVLSGVSDTRLLMAQYYRDELNRRTQRAYNEEIKSATLRMERATEDIRLWTRQVRDMTMVIVGLTIVTALVSVFRR